MALRGTLTHRKTRRLSRVLGVPPCYALGVLEALWHLTAEQFPDGDIGALSAQDIADEIFFDGDANVLISALTEAGFLDATEHSLVVHGWSERAENGIHAALAKKTLLFADGTMPRVPHEWFSAPTRERIKSEYAAKYPDKSGQVPDKSPPNPTTKPSNHQTKPSNPTTTKEGRTVADAPPSIDDCRAYALERFGLNGSFAEMFHEHYENTGWVDAKGKPYQNWKNLMRVWVDKRSDGQLEKYRPKAQVDTSMVHR